MDIFINECVSSLAFKERESSEFLIGLLNELLPPSQSSSSNGQQKIQQNNSTIVNTSSQSSLSNEPKSSATESTETSVCNDDITNQLMNDHISENYFLDKNECFNNLIQFELQSYDSEFENVSFLNFNLILIIESNKCSIESN